MMRILSIPWITCLLALFALGASTAACRDKKLDARALANALADEYTDWLEFENGVAEEGPPPSGSNDPALPQIDLAASSWPAVISPELSTAPAADYGQWFDLRLAVVGDVSQVSGAVVHVVQANTESQAPGIIRVSPPSQILVAPDNAVILRARVNRVPDLSGNAFTIRLALQSPAGLGGFVNWNLVTLPAAGESTVVPLCPCTNGTIPDQCLPDFSQRTFNLYGSCTNQALYDHVQGEICQSPDMVANVCFVVAEALGVDEMELEGVLFPEGTWLPVDWMEPGNYCTLAVDCSNQSATGP